MTHKQACQVQWGINHKDSAHVCSIYLLFNYYIELTWPSTFYILTAFENEQRSPAAAPPESHSRAKPSSSTPTIVKPVHLAASSPRHQSQSSEKNIGQLQSRAGENCTLERNQRTKAKLYKNREEICKLLGIKLDDLFAMRDRREFIKMQCAKRDMLLCQPYESLKEDDLARVVKNVTAECKTQFGGWWSNDVVRALIHRICIDNVRNEGARNKRREMQNTRLSGNNKKSRAENRLRKKRSSPKQSSNNGLSSDEEIVCKYFCFRPTVIIAQL
jgi:hypothetical protein